MGILKDNALRKFELSNPKAYKEIVEQIYIGDFETLFKLSDGSRIIFDEIQETTLYLRARDTDDPFLTEIEWKNELCRKLNKKMLMRGMTQKSLADALDISTTTVSLYVKGKRCPDTYMLHRISRVFDYPFCDLHIFDYLL
jgi:DNA-binding XRE family transcriptional regulator